MMSGQNSWIILALILGVVVLAAVAVITLSGGGGKKGPTPTPAPGTEALLPEVIAGFELASRFDHIEPIFPGELYSLLVSFAPLEGSDFAGAVERMGITAYLFEDEESAKEALDLLIGSTYSGAQGIQVEGLEAYLFAEPEAGQAGLLWQDGSIVYEIFVTAPSQGEPDLEKLKEAALTGARAVISLKS